ncbi:hypothetical protein SUGI_0043830 [Cryptomeria japonica]|nr:hypothetical protein SUGI_0043830 [Cryptomeria japonica]
MGNDFPGASIHVSSMAVEGQSKSFVQAVLGNQSAPEGACFVAVQSSASEECPEDGGRGKDLVGTIVKYVEPQVKPNKTPNATGSQLDSRKSDMDILPSSNTHSPDAKKDDDCASLGGEVDPGSGVMESECGVQKMEAMETSLPEENKEAKWAIIPFSGNPNEDLLDDAMEKFGIKKAKEKFAIKEKDRKKKEDASSLGAEQMFEFKRKRGRPNGSIASMVQKKGSNSQLPKCYNSFRAPMDTAS